MSKVSKFLKAEGKAIKRMNAKRTPITQMLIDVRKEFEQADLIKLLAELEADALMIAKICRGMQRRLSRIKKGVLTYCT
jgi:hypothetical protein